MVVRISINYFKTFSTYWMKTVLSWMNKKQLHKARGPVDFLVRGALASRQTASQLFERTIFDRNLPYTRSTLLSMFDRLICYYMHPKSISTIISHQAARPRSYYTSTHGVPTSSYCCCCCGNNNNTHSHEPLHK